MGFLVNGNAPMTAGMPTSTPSDRAEAQRILRPALPEWCKKTVAGVEKDPPDRTAMNNFARVMDLLGEGMEVNLHLHVQKRYGIAFDELLAAYKGSQEAESGSLDDWQRDALGVLKLVLDKEPERRTAIMAALGGRDALVEGNGTNGHG